MIEKFILLFYNILILLLPYCLKLKGLTYSKIIFVYSILVTFYLIYKKKINRKILLDKKIKIIILSYLLFTFIVGISSVVQNFNSGITISDIFEIIRPIYYILILINYYVLVKDNKKFFTKTLAVLFVINILISIFQYFNIFDLNKYYVKFIAPTQYITLVDNYIYPRSVGLVGNPNELGFIFVIIMTYFLNEALKQPKKIINYLLYIIGIFGVYTTMSRTNFICMIVAGLLTIIVNTFKFSLKNIKKTIIILLLFLILQSLILFLLPNKYTWRIKDIFNIDKINSWNKRQDLNKDFFEDNKENNDSKNNNINKNETTDPENNNIDKEETKNNISKKDKTNENDKQIKKRKSIKDFKWYNYLIGNGPNKKNKFIFDNEWLKLFYNYGIMGIISFIIMTIIPIKYFKNKDNKIYLPLIITSYLYMVTSALYYHYCIFSLLIVFLAIYYNSDCKSKTNN